jgi:hypothetical protein
VRVVALLSPTCGGCQRGQRVVQSVFSKYPHDPRLRGFVVWLPMLRTDSEQAAEMQAGAFVDGRLVQRWDGDRAAGDLIAKRLGLNRTAWNVYLLMHRARNGSAISLRCRRSGCINSIPTVLLGEVADLLR